MLREILFFFRHGPGISRIQASVGRVEFLQRIARQLDEDGLARYRRELVGDLQGKILEVGTGTGATLPYYGEKARVTALEPDDEFRAAAEEVARTSRARIHCVPGTGESIPFGDESFDTVTASGVLCSVTSIPETLAEFRRVLRPRGHLRLLEHVRSEHWLAGPLMDLLNPIWLRLNKMGCNWNRKSVEAVRDAGFKIIEVKPYKLYSTATPAAYPSRLIKAEKNAVPSP
jgi:ubiquinone/menaquinone biosynthesis C-methylase UbiE